MNVRALLAAVLFYAASSSGAVRFTATTDHTTVAPGEQVTVTAELVVDKSLKIASPPLVGRSDAFDVVRTDQNQSSSTQIQFINGRASQSKEIHYQFSYVIVPKRAGAFTFPALQVVIDNTPHATEPIPFNAAAEPAKNPDVRVFVSLSRQPLYVGEQVILTLKVAQRANSPTQVDRGFNAAIDALEKPLAKSFSLSRLFTNQVTSGAERIDGEMHRTFSLRWALIPLAPGSFTVQPVPFGYAEIRQVRRRSMDPFFDDFFNNDFFGGGTQAVGKTAFSAEFVLRVKELPPPPAGFSGTIGRVSLIAAVDPQSVPAGEAATLKIAIQAATRPGNVAEINAPKLENCEVFSPEKHVEVDTAPGGITTKKSYKFLLIPRKEGGLVIPPVALSYFDPQTGQYRTASSAALSIAVTAGKAGKQEQTRYLTQEEIRQIGSDIRYIKNASSVRSVSEKPYREPLFFLLYPLPFALFGLSLLYRFQSRRREANAAHYVRSRAFRVACRTLDGLRRQGEKVKAPQFLGAVADALERFLSEKFGFAATGRTLEELTAELKGRTADGQAVAGLAAFIELLDAYRFGGAAFDEKSRAAIIDKAKSFCASLQKSSSKGARSVQQSAAVLLLGALCMAGALPAAAAPVELWFDQGNSFYTNQRYDSAAVAYEKIVAAGVSNSAVFFNLGNAYFRLKKLGLARLCYEKAAAIDPADPDIAANIRFVASAIVDRVPDSERGFLETIVWRLHVLLPLRAQLWLCFGLLSLIALLSAAALFASGNRRLWLIYAASLLSLVLLASGLSMGYKIWQSETCAYAVLLDSSVDARNEPDGAKVLFTAHEGTKFQIRKSVERWSLVSLPNGISGWVENKALGRIF